MRVDRSIKCFVLMLATLLPAQLIAQQQADPNPGRKNQIGDIILEHGEAQSDPYEVTQDKVLAHFTSLKDLTVKLAAGESGSVAPLEDTQLQYLNSLYLYCILRKGTCVTVLDAILEMDIVNARQSKQVDCPNMSMFWKLWVRNDMEKRHNYSVPTGFMKTVEDFNKNERPKYVRCAGQVQDEISGTSADAKFFTDRYREGSPKKKNIEAMIALIDEIKAKGLNVFAATDTESTPAKPQSKGGGAKSSGNNKK